MRLSLALFTLAPRSVGALALTGLFASSIAAANLDSTSTSAMSTVSGTVHFAHQKAKMTHLYRQRKTTDEGPVLALYFSSHPLPLRMLDDRQKLQQLAKKGGFVGLYVEINDDGQIRQSELLHDDGVFSGPWRFEPPNGKPTTAAGRIATEGEREFFGKPYAVDVTFKTDGKPTAAWSGSPFYETKPTGLPVGRAEGWIERQGKKTELSHALAVAETDLFGDSGARSLLLTAKPITDEMLVASRGPEQALSRDGIAFLRVRIDGKGEVESLLLPSSDGHAMTFSSTQWNLELANMPPGEIDGSMEATDADPKSEFPRYQLRFHATTRKIGAAEPVTATNGKPLPKDGGEPGRAYHDFAKALKAAKTVEELLPLRIASLASKITDVPPEHRARMLSFLKEQAVTPNKIVGGFANENQATLWLEGRQDGERMEGRVNVHRENGAWKLGSESFRIGHVESK